MLKKNKFNSSNIYIVILASIISIILTSFPVYQLFVLDGLVFYTNALDEGGYLQYDFSKIAYVATARFSQLLVTYLHELGFSGGRINFLFDLLTPFVIILISHSILIKLNFKSYQSVIGSLLLATFPLLINCFNPLVGDLFNTLVETKWLEWVTMPQADFSPLQRTPEPQFSILLIVATIYFFVILNRPVCLFLCIPFIYSFLAIPWAYISLSFLLRNILARHVKNDYLILFLSFLTFSIFLNIYFNYFVDYRTQGLLLKSSLPLISYSGFICLVIYKLSGSEINDTSKFLQHILVTAPWASTNHQIISGWIAVPSNIEQYFGVYCVLVTLFLALNKKVFWLKSIFILSFVAFLLSNIKYFIHNYSLSSHVNENKKVIEWLYQDAGSLATNNLHMSVLLNLVYPMQQPTFFSYSKVYLGQVESYLNDYICAKNEIEQDLNLNSSYQHLFYMLDHALQDETEDYYLNTLFRKTCDVHKYNVYSLPNNCDELKLKHFIVQ
jgi:hypothetical protein